MGNKWNELKPWIEVVIMSGKQRIRNEATTYFVRGYKEQSMWEQTATEWAETVSEAICGTISAGIHNAQDPEDAFMTMLEGILAIFEDHPNWMSIIYLFNAISSLLQKSDEQRGNKPTTLSNMPTRLKENIYQVVNEHMHKKADPYIRTMGGWYDIIEECQWIIEVDDRIQKHQ